MTSDEPQSRSLLAGEDVFHLRYVPPRRADLVLANMAAARRLLQEEEYARVITTGIGDGTLGSHSGAGPRNPLLLGGEFGARNGTEPDWANCRKNSGNAPFRPISDLGE